MANIGSYMLCALILFMIILPILVWQIYRLNIFFCEKYQFIASHVQCYVLINANNPHTGGTGPILLLLMQILVHSYKHLLLKVTKLLLLPVSQYADPLLLYAQCSIVTVCTVLVVYAQC